MEKDYLKKNDSDIILQEPLPTCEDEENRNILHRNENILIFLNKTNQLGWELKNIPEPATPALQEFILINASIVTYLNRIDQKYTSILLASKLYYCLTTKNDYDIEEVFKDVKELVHSRKENVKNKVIETSKFSVYINKNNDVNWWYYKDIPEYMIGALDELEVLSDLSTYALPKSNKIIMAKKLASALGNAFNKSTYDAAKDCFKDTRSFLVKKSESYLRLKLFLISILFSSIFILFVGFIPKLIPQVKIYLIGAVAGVLGAMISSLQRNNTISIEHYASEYSLYCECISRLIIGAIFGGFLVLGTKSEIFLAPFKNNIQAIICFSFISGFVERFIPDLINGFTKKRD